MLGRRMSLPAGLPLIAVLNGPNMNMLGLGDPEVYGSDTLDAVEQLCAETAEALGVGIDFRQTNSEGELISWVRNAGAAPRASSSIPGRSPRRRWP